MDLNSLNEKYQTDVKVNQLELENEAQRSPNLHAEYVRYWTEERRILFALLREMKVLRLEKDDFYSKGPSKEQKAKGWEYPGGMILKTKVPVYIEADKQVVELQEKIDEAQIKVDALEKIVQQLSYRQNTINLIFSIRKWEGGG
ncbi:MAG TPA: recombination mediator protein UvsY [Methylomirabilota bacterium]|nr:recombination mediator protein UvsY [Methylomirabilota bacterium]